MDLSGKEAGDGCSVFAGPAGSCAGGTRWWDENQTGGRPVPRQRIVGTACDAAAPRARGTKAPSARRGDDREDRSGSIASTGPAAARRDGAGTARASGEPGDRLQRVGGGHGAASAGTLF